MKKLAILSLLFALVTLAAFTTRSRWSQIRQEPVTLIDSVRLFDVRAVRMMQPTDAALVQAARYYRQAMDSMFAGSGAASFMLLSLRSYPVPDVYRAYDGMAYSDSIVIASAGIADSLHGYIRPSQYMDAAKYALSIRDTTSMIRLLQWYMSDDDRGYLRVDREAFLQPFENYPDYYYMMDDYIKHDSTAAYQSALRTMRFTAASELPYALTDQVINKSYQNSYDSTVSPPRFVFPFGLQDDAMRDVIKGNRFGRFSRFTDHSIQYVATLHLSDKYNTYVYSTSFDFTQNEMTLEVAIDEDGKVIEPSKDQRTPEVYDSPNEIFLVTIDKYGKKISEQQIGCRCSPLRVSLSSIDKSGLIEIRDMEQWWEKDPIVAGYKNNKIAGRNVTAIRHYKVKNDGTITAITEAATANK